MVPAQRRVAIAIAAGCIAWALITIRFRRGGAYLYALDFTPHWRAADAMLRGYSPYVVINAFTNLYPFGAGYLYMLPATILLLPFGYLPPQVAAALFEGVATGVFAFALMRDGYWRLPLLASAPLYYGVVSGQTVPLVTAAFLLPSLGWLAPLKHTTGAVGAAFSLSKRYLIGALGVVIVSVIIWPWWPAQWWAERFDVFEKYYHIPVLVTGGFLLLLGVLRWRRREARALVAMSCLPQTMFFYDQLPLVLIARNFREAVYVTAGSWVGPLVGLILVGTLPISRRELFAIDSTIVVFAYYLPCLAVILLRPNVGAVPTWLERASARLPQRFRGRSSVSTALDDPSAQVAAK
jgi:hypothetical protein